MPSPFDGGPMKPLPDKMVGSRGQTLYPWGDPPNKDYHPVSQVEDKRDMRDPTALGDFLMHEHRNRKDTPASEIYDAACLDDSVLIKNYGESDDEFDIRCNRRFGKGGDVTTRNP